MLWNSLLAAGVLAAQASAFLIPSSPEAGVAQINNELKHQVVELDCPGCPFAGADGDGSVWVQEQSPSTLHLEFDITDDNQFLQINGQAIFPPPKTLIPIALTATQTRTTDSSHTAPLRLGYALEFLPPVTQVTDITLMPVQLTILNLEGVAVKVDTVKLDLIRSQGALHIARVTQIPYAQSPGVNICTTSICRLRAIIAHRLRVMIEAARSKAGKATSWLKKGCSGRKPAHAQVEQDHQKTHPPHHHAHHHMGQLRHMFRQMIHLFVIPALFGFWGGLVVCSLGLLVGGALVRSIRRRAARDVVRHLEDAVEEDEKDVLVESAELPPQYDDVEVVIVEEK